MASKGAKHAALLLTTLLGAARASPQDKPPAGVQSTSKKHHGVPHGLTAVGLPTPWSAAAPVSSVVQGHLAPTMHASGQASSGLWACLVAGAGAVGQNIRQNREPRRRQARARQVTPTEVAEVAVEPSEPDLEGGWQTESEDESVEHLRQIGRQNQLQFLQQVGQEAGQPNPFPQVQAFQQFYEAPQVNQQMMYWQPAMNQFNQMPMQVDQQRLPMQNYVPEGMVLVVVPVVPDGANHLPAGDAATQGRMAPHLEEARGYQAPHPRAPSVSASSVSEISTEVSFSGAPRARARWNNKESEAVVRQLRSSDAAQRRRLMEQVAEDTWAMAITKHGTRVVQAALEAGELSERLKLLAALRGRVWQALKSPHANHVLQKAIALMPPKKLDFVVLELRGRVGDAARHPFGCRVLERLLEHCPGEQTEVLSREVIADVLELSRHPYGNYVVQHTLEHGTALQKQQLCEAMRLDIGRLARHKVASHVVERALLHSGPEERRRLKEAMASNAEELASLTASNYGSFVVKEMKKR